MPKSAIDVFEPPLVADHFDGERILRPFGELEDRLDGRHGDTGQDEGRDGGPQHLEFVVAVDLLRFLAAVLVAEHERNDEDGALDEHEDGGGDPEHQPPQAVDLLGDGSGRVERVERGVGDARH